jgi:D-alanyl-D-alanine carboxypeptidase/D-alanyl-D-alanine-endopeptidase (penicillin-binding protein 4)
VAYFGAALRDALAQEGITVQGSTLPVDRLPGPWWELVDSHRTLLISALDVTNKRSQNFYAESLFKLLGARGCNDGSWAGGARVVSDFLVREVGWQRGAFRVADGSGMSRNDRVTPRQLTQLLEHMFDGRWGVEYVRSLPFAGEPDASLHRRLDDPPYRGNVFAKTGTLEGVSALSGYAKGRSGRLYAFSILANAASAWEGRVVQDRIVRALVDNG